MDGDDDSGTSFKDPPKSPKARIASKSSVEGAGNGQISKSQATPAQHGSLPDIAVTVTHAPPTKEAPAIPKSPSSTEADRSNSSSKKPPNRPPREGAVAIEKTKSAESLPIDSSSATETKPSLTETKGHTVSGYGLLTNEAPGKPGLIEEVKKRRHRSTPKRERREINTELSASLSAPRQNTPLSLNLKQLEEAKAEVIGADRSMTDRPKEEPKRTSKGAFDFISALTPRSRAKKAEVDEAERRPLSHRGPTNSRSASNLFQEKLFMRKKGSGDAKRVGTESDVSGNTTGEGEVSISPRLQRRTIEGGRSGSIQHSELSQEVGNRRKTITHLDEDPNKPRDPSPANLLMRARRTKRAISGLVSTKKETDAIIDFDDEGRDEQEEEENELASDNLIYRKGDGLWGVRMLPISHSIFRNETVATQASLMECSPEECGTEDMVANSFGWKCEPALPKEARSINDLQEYNLEYPHYDCEFYRKYFYGEDHTTYFATEQHLGPVIVSLKKDKTVGFYTALIRTKKGDVMMQVPLALIKTKMNSKQIVKEIAYNEGRPPKLKLNEIRTIEDQNLKEELVRFEKMEYFKEYKFGVLLVKEGQTEDDQFFSNTEGSKHWEELLHSIGARVKLKGFIGFAAGLDTKSDSTGTYTYYAAYRDCQVMFHVSTELPFDKDDLQRIQRKRHLGNDVVNIVFLDGDVKFNPESIKSQFIHVYAIIKVDPQKTAETGETHFRVAIMSQVGVAPFGPPLPPRGVLHHSQLKRFLLAKLINGERAAYQAPAIRFKLQSTRLQTLKMLTQS